MAANPVPDIGSWAAVEDPDARLRAALSVLYPYYRRTRPMLENLYRDEETVPTVKASFGRFREYLAAACDTLMAGRRARGRAHDRVRAAIGHALAFATWRSLTLDEGLDDREAAELMCRLVAAAQPPGRAHTLL